eukprot:TRINITY_DN15289_c0_g2_i7.p1 TRINITY_DN15289_c0_g2~~TRINITY_DN15289_c0_g2_i7.p1  ORF type:complete len:719 (-),score=52.04 TRINITY_DN15289_c0_g2_i7:220-2376(-)
MSTISFSAVVPGNDNVDPEEYSSSSIPLEDISLIVIGRGPIAEEIVRRRRSVGGRVCWLWSERFPLAPLVATQDSITSLWAHRLAFEEHSHWDFETCTHAQAGGVADFRLDMSSFVWKPPKHELHSPLVEQIGLLDRKRLWRLRRHFGTSYMAWRATGPDIVRLGLDEDYRLIERCDGRAAGIQVVDSRTSALHVIWEMSGKVVFAGQQFHDFHLHPGATIISSAAAAAQADFGNPSEEAKPFVTVNAMHVCMWCGVSFVQFVAFFVLMSIYEPQMQPGDLPWWLVSFSILTIAPFAYSAFPDILGLSLTGRQPERRLAVLLCLVGSLTQFVACVSPAGWMHGHWRTWPLYTVQSFFVIMYMTVGLLLYAWKMHRSRKGSAMLGTRFRCYAHVMWYCWILLGTFGIWTILYGVALVYIMLSNWSQVAASLFLPAMTSCVEIGTLMTTVWVYGRLVHAPRMNASGSRKQNCSMLGDQKLTMMPVICMTHAYSESTRLVSLLVTVVKDPSWNFMYTLLACFLTNVLLRCNVFTEVISRIVPRSWWCLFAPDAGTVMLNEVRVYFGYPRFVSLAALALSNLIVHGSSKWPFFNYHSAALVLIAAALELAEDMIVCSGYFTATSWRDKTSSYYRGIHPLSLSQVMGFDRDEVQPNGPAIGFSGMRYLPFRCVVVIVAPACFFAYNLLSLLLGAGFIHDVCATWIQEEKRLLDGLVWQTPLLC